MEGRNFQEIVHVWWAIQSILEPFEFSHCIHCPYMPTQSNRKFLLKEISYDHINPYRKQTQLNQA
eukprot:c9731_g1_i1 orf=3-197(+)